MVPARGIPKFADSSVVHDPARQELSEGIFTARSEAWGPGKGIFKTRWAIPRGIYEAADYAGGQVVDASQTFRDHGIYGIPAMPNTPRPGDGGHDMAPDDDPTLGFLGLSRNQLKKLALIGAVGFAIYYLFFRKGGAGRKLLGIRTNQARAPRARKWIQKAVKKPGAYRESVLRRYGASAFTPRGTIKADILAIDLRHPRKAVRKMAQLAKTLRGVGR